MAVNADMVEVDDDRMTFTVAASDAHMVEIGTSSIVGENEGRSDVQGAAVGVSYAEESFIAANANPHEETMFDDDITSALLNGINNGGNGPVCTAV